MMLLRREGIGVAGIAFVADAEGWAWTSDINTISKHSPDVEQAHGPDGMGAVAQRAGRCLAEATAPALAPAA